MASVVQATPAASRKIVHPVVPAKAFAPEENRVEGARAVKRDGEQKIMPVSDQAMRQIKAKREGASGKLVRGFSCRPKRN